MHGLAPEVLVLVDGFQQLQPCPLPHAEVEESLHYVEFLHGRAVLHQILSYLVGRLLRTLSGSLHKGEHHQCEVSFKLAACLLQLQHLFIGFHAVECLHGLASSLADQCFYIHGNNLLMNDGIMGGKQTNPHPSINCTEAEMHIPKRL